MQDDGLALDGLGGVADSAGYGRRHSRKETRRAGVENKNSERPQRYLSVPTLNKINNEEYPEGRQTNPDHFYGSELSIFYKKKRSKSLVVPSRSSTNAPLESAPFKLVDVHIEQRTSFLPVQNVSTASSNHSSNKTTRDEVSRISEERPPMTQAYSVSRGPADPEGSAGAPLVAKNFESSEIIQPSRSSKARQKKFHRHFKQVDVDEKVLNYYSCALVGDILLQGHLYITENFFAFYSNVFGYVTKLLIPTVDVLKISKEKTAKIIPNAVGISTEDEKHVFGSLLSRDSTYKFMLQVWKAANSSNSVANTPPPIIKTELPSDEDSSVSTGNEDPSSYISNMTTGPSSESFQKLLPSMKRKSVMAVSAEAAHLSRCWNTGRVKVLLGVSVALLIFLFASAGYLLYRIALIQNHFNDLSLSPKGSEMYEEILKWQSTLHSTSANKIYDFLNANLNQIIKVRLSLEALSMLILPRKPKPKLNSKWRSRNAKEDGEEAATEEN